MNTYTGVYAIPVTRTGDFYDGGLFIRNGNLLNRIEPFCKQSDTSLQIRSDTYHLNPNDHIKVYRGKSIFIGVVYGHFGHFISETIPYLQGIDFSSYDNIVALKHGDITKHDIIDTKYAKTVFNCYGIDFDRIQFCESLSLYESLTCLPYRYGLSSINELPNDCRNELISLGNTLSNISSIKSRYKKILVSTKNFSRNSIEYRSIEKVEKFLADHDYQIIYPEKHLLEDQVSLYKNTEQIILISGSAIHTLLLCMGQPNIINNVGIIISNRHQGVVHRYNFESQLKECGFKYNIFNNIMHDEQHNIIHLLDEIYTSDFID